MTIEIKLIQPHQIPEAKRVILSVAYNIFKWQGSLEESIQFFEERGELQDVDDLQAHYLERKGTFLVAMVQGKVIGTGAIRYNDDETAELKRLWLLEIYHGQGIGYRLLQDLLSFAKRTGYKRIRLLTSSLQERAIRFYQRVGFHPIQCEEDDEDDVCMEMEI